MQKIIIANWKMNPRSQKEAERLFVSTLNILNNEGNESKLKTIICPPYVYLDRLHKLLKTKVRNPKISLGVQNIFWEKEGAFTGEISGDMVYDLGARYVILGHSERRTLGEDNLSINKKIKMAFASGLTPIVCFGEEKRDEDHDYLNLIKKQVEECFSQVSKSSIPDILIAYEPVWAVGKGGVPATPSEFREMNIFIKKILRDKFGVKASQIRILYGGSVNDKNAPQFLEEGQADGFLIGRASLDAKKLKKILEGIAK